MRKYGSFYQYIILEFSCFWFRWSLILNSFQARGELLSRARFCSSSKFVCLVLSDSEMAPTTCNCLVGNWVAKLNCATVFSCKDRVKREAIGSRRSYPSNFEFCSRVIVRECLTLCATFILKIRFVTVKVTAQITVMGFAHTLGTV